MSSLLVVTASILFVSKLLAFEFEFIADLSCIGAYGQPSSGFEGSTSTVICPNDYAMTNCGYTSHGIWSQGGNFQNIIQANRAKPDGSRIENGLCIAQNGQTITE
eukprot:849182_1